MLIIVQARMDSQRFPGKVLLNIKDKPVIQHIVDSIRQAFPNHLIHIASSTNESNDELEQYCRTNNINMFRGDEQNVASRFVSIVKKYSPQYFVRISGDSPLFDYRVIIKAAEYLSSNDDLDIISTIAENRFPSGMNVEIINARTFLKEYTKFSKDDHFEHVTPYFYENRSRFNIVQVANKIDEPDTYKFSLDTADDLVRIKELFDALTPHHYHYSLLEKCEVYNKLVN